ncbi:MAG: hypothetical protein R2856_27830 [Caldilineaceae bacterium]
MPLPPGNGQGAVSSPAGIDCGVDCSETLEYGTVITLTATPEHRLHLHRLDG